MFDGIKILDLSVSAGALLQHYCLQFGALVDLQAGAVLDHKQKATNRGLTFRLIPSTLTGRTSSDGIRYRVELIGSLHRYSRCGLHNADDFTATDLRQTVEELVNTYGIDAHSSALNNLEFGVNLQLPYPAADLLRALICYRGIPFERHTENGFTYYQAELFQYVVKVYDKGLQCALPVNLLRVEVKVLKMQYLHKQGIGIRTLADLLNREHYAPLGVLLAEVFTDILFDEPLLSIDDVSTRHRELLLQGRNPRYWQRSTWKAGKEYARQQKNLKREERRFRKLLADHRPGNDWQRETAALLLQKWEELTRPNCPKFTGLSDRETSTPTAPKCPLFTDFGKESKTGELSVIYPLDVREITDNGVSEIGAVLSDRETPQNECLVCPVTGVPLTSTKTGGRGIRRFVSPTMLRTDDGLMMELAGRFGQYAKGSKEDDYTRTAHNVRNTFNNPRHNLKRSINKIHHQPTLFDVEGTLRLRSDQRALLDSRS